MHFSQLEISAAIVGVVGVLLQAGVPHKLAPLMAAVLGGLAGAFFMYPGQPAHGIMVGVTVGLGAVGIHSGVKNTKQGVQNLAQSLHKKKVAKLKAEASVAKK